MKERVFLGVDKRDVEEQQELWLSKNPAIKVLRVHGPRREPRTLLTPFGGKNIPRFSITVDYEESDIEPTHPSEKRPGILQYRAIGICRPIVLTSPS